MFQTKNVSDIESYAICVWGFVRAAQLKDSAKKSHLPGQAWGPMKWSCQKGRVGADVRI